MRSVNGSASVLFKQFASQHKRLESHYMQVYVEVTMLTRVLSSCSGGHYQGSSQPAQPACRASSTGHHSPAASQPVAVAAAERWVTPPPLVSPYSHFPLSSTGLPHNFFLFLLLSPIDWYDVMLPHSCGCEPIKSPFTHSHWASVSVCGAVSGSLPWNKRKEEAACRCCNNSAVLNIQQQKTNTHILCWWWSRKGVPKLFHTIRVYI